MNKTEKKHIAFIYEGVSAEDRLLTNMQNAFLSDVSEVEFIGLPADGNIYMLWNRLVEDEFETNVIDILKEMSVETKKRLDEKGLKASHFSEIYLFFDYDGHAPEFSEETLAKADKLCRSKGMPEIKNKRDLLERLLLVFNNETEHGKLYVSYPMVESIREISIKEQTYKRLHIPLELVPKYKHSFGEKSHFAKYSNITKDMWLTACVASVEQANIIVTYKSKCSYEEFIRDVTQINIYHAEKENYINNGKLLAVLNSIPLFLVEYFDERFWKEHIENLG